MLPLPADTGLVPSEAGFDGLAPDDAPAVGGYAWLPGLAAVAEESFGLTALAVLLELLLPAPPVEGDAGLPGVFCTLGLAGLPGSCKCGYLPEPCR